MPRHKLLNYIGTIVAATVQINVSNTINHDGRLAHLYRESTDLVVTGRRLRCLDVPCDGLPVSAVSKARSAGIAALEPCARAEIATLI
jgi:hypothetical protein